MVDLKYIRFFLGSLLVLGVISCGPPIEEHGKSNKLDQKEDPNVYCVPSHKELGEIFEYEGVDGKMRRSAQFEEVKTAAGFTMRIPKGVGGLGHPNKKCEMERGKFEFRWADGELLPVFDYKTGRRNNVGSSVEYFVRFVPPEQNLVEKFEYPKWMFDGAFRIAGHNEILVLPFGDVGAPKFIPVDRNNRALWRPKILLKDARDLAGNSATFFCGSLSYEDGAGGVHVAIKNFKKNSTHCMTNIAFASGAGGRLDIYDEDFFSQGAAITNLVMREVNSYVVKE